MVNPYSAYRRQDLATTGKNELVAKLYESAALSLRRAKQHIGEGRLDKASAQMIHAQNIMIALNDSLDMSYSISGQLRTVYSYTFRRIQEANIHKDTAILDETAELLTGMRDTWEKAVHLSRMTQGTAGGAA